MEEPKYKLITLEDGTEAREYADGSIRNEKGHMIKPLAGKFTFTQANAREMQSLAAASRRLAKARGKMRAIGLDPDDVDPVAGSLMADEEITMHLTRTFLGSKNLRGMGETYTKLVSDGDGDAGRDANGQAAVIRELTKLVSQIVPDREPVIDLSGND